MTGGDTRAAIIGLAGFAAAEEHMLLATAPVGEEGDPTRWAAVPLVAHNTEFKQQQVQRLDAIVLGRTPPEFGDIDHGSAEVYGGYLAKPVGEVAAGCSRTTGDLIENLGLISDADLTDSSRHPWLRGRQLWLQIVVRGFWHPTGHLIDYYLAHSAPDRALELSAHGVATANYLRAPDQARGMASYNLACAQARTGRLDEAAATLTEAIKLNPDLTANATRDRDLAELAATGRLDRVLADT
jgi:tetratricopeptide (TPR) repeat protein